jgi:hypothetical protein
VAKVDLVFRQVDERTRAVALDLAVRHIRPDNVHIMDDVRPFTECVQQMLRIEHDCDYVVYVDADCLILEDLRGFIDSCGAAYVDSYVTDRFRGRIHCGVHITRADLVQRMAEVEVPPDDLKFVLRPESRTRNLAMKPLRMSKQFRNFDILHDHFQYYRHIFVKYALRELRSRTAKQHKRLRAATREWAEIDGEAADFEVARYALEYAGARVPKDAPADTVHRFIESLPERATTALEELGVNEKADFDEGVLEAWLGTNSNRIRYGRSEAKPKVFGVGLSRTGTRSLTAALQVLGFDTVHYPVDEDTFRELAYGQYDLTILKDHDGLTDITTVPYYQQLDHAFPGSKFVLTVRDEVSWLRSCQTHWFNRPALKPGADYEQEVHFNMRRLLRAAVYGCYNFVPERFAWVYRQHVRGVLDYFKDRPEDLLVLDVCGGEGFEKLAPFLERPIPTEPFAHKGAVLSRRVAKAQTPAP